MSGRPYALGHVVIYAYDEETGIYESVRIDDESKAILMINTDHYEVHQGNMYSITYLQPHGSELANDASVEILFVVGAKEAHLESKLSTGGDFEIRLFEGTTVSAAGAAIPSFNRNRESAKTATATVTSAPTVTGDGTELAARFVPGGTGGLTPGESVRTGTEIILAPNTNYLFRVTNRAGTAQQFGLKLEWYEV